MRGVAAVLVVEIDELVAMDAVEGEDDHHDEVGNEEAGVKEIGAIEALEGVVSVVALEVVHDSVLGQEQQEREQIERAEQGANLRGARRSVVDCTRLSGRV